MKTYDRVSVLKHSIIYAYAGFQYVLKDASAQVRTRHHRLCQKLTMLFICLEVENTNITSIVTLLMNVHE